MSFEDFSRRVAYHAGRPWAFTGALAVVAVWLASSPFFGWQHTHTVGVTFVTCVTFLLLFVVQATQNRHVAEIKAMLREMAEDIDEVDEVRAAERVAEEEKP